MDTTREVEREFLQSEREIRKISLSNAPWIKTVDLMYPQNALVYDRLDKGEAEVLALAFEHNASILLIDEKKARQDAEDKGFQVKGTLGILLEAKSKGLLNTISPYITELQENKIRLSNSLIDYVLNEADEI